MKCFWKHNWGKWKEYEVDVERKNMMTEVSMVGCEIREKRRCKDCGKTQDRKVR